LNCDREKSGIRLHCKMAWQQEIDIFVPSSHPGLIQALR